MTKDDGTTVKLTTKEGVLFNGETMVDIETADQIARANGFAYAEQLTKKYQWIVINTEYKITRYKYHKLTINHSKG